MLNVLSLGMGCTLLSTYSLIETKCLVHGICQFIYSNWISNTLLRNSSHESPPEYVLVCRQFDTAGTFSPIFHKLFSSITSSTNSIFEY